MLNKILNGLKAYIKRNEELHRQIPKLGDERLQAHNKILNEFQPDMIIYLGDQNGKLIHETTVSNLLPDAFGPENLG